ncbi:MAG: hypothetical protein GX447_04355 [Elusimicrobia bacterium]|nr:hypothetical protein [Elusimicrobiota bacterium]
MEFLKDIWNLIKERKKWWLIPAVIVLFLIGALIFLSSGSAVAPFIYTVF